MNDFERRASFGTIRLSLQARSLWAKSDYGEQRAWLPLFIHMVDASFVARFLWDEWVPQATKTMITSSLGVDAVLAKQLLVFLGAIHDIGKVTPAFQSTPITWCYQGEDSSLRWMPEQAGLPFDLGVCGDKAPKHPLAGQVIIERILKDRQGISSKTSRCISSIVGCHHGKPSYTADVRMLQSSRPASMGFGSEVWESVQGELFSFALQLAGLTYDEMAGVAQNYVPPQAASILSGLLIMCDWMASNAEAFPLVPLISSEYSWCVDGEDEDNLIASDLGCCGDSLDMDRFAERAERGWDYLDLLPAWREVTPLSDGNDLYQTRFQFPEGARPRPIQTAAVEIASTLSDPGLLIIEAPMGEGKTEAALAAAELFAIKTGAGGVCVALPTMATTDAMFGRVHNWLKHVPNEGECNNKSMYLAHGKAQLNEEFQGIARAYRNRSCSINCDEEEGDPFPDVVISDWMFGRKRGMLANFVVCTVDQVLMGALQMKHLALRQLSLANKVVIIDECHAYDMYMRQYLNDVLGWLGSWHVPVILLSATLPEAQRTEMLQSYLDGRMAMTRRKAPHRTWRKAGENRRECKQGGESVSVCVATSAYPLLTYTDGSKVAQRPVEGTAQASDVILSVMSDELDDLVKLLQEKLQRGGCAGVVCDTVGRAQEAADALARVFGHDKVTLMHARFTDLDRMAREKKLREMLGPKATLENGGRPSLHIVVGTQVLEQSLDIDFDLLVTDVAPIDLLFQRMGRCHRHVRVDRPEPLRMPMCYVRGITEWQQEIPHFDDGVQRVYEPANLLEALAVCGLLRMGEGVSLSLPRDIARLVRQAYGPDVVSAIPEAWSETYEQTCAARLEHEERARRRAHGCLLKSASCMIRDGSTLTDWYDIQRRSDNRDEDWGPRAVRDTQETVEVMALHRRDNRIYLLPWIGDADGGIAPGSEVPTDVVPDAAIAKVAAQSTVRLPVTLSAPDRIEELVVALEEMDSNVVGAWQESPWMQGQLALLLEDDDEGGLSVVLDLGERRGIWRVSYARESGLTVHRNFKNTS